MRQPLLTWSSESHSVYIPEIDEEHQALFRLISEIYGELIDSPSLGPVSGKLRELAAQTISHLTHEEKLMRASMYPLRAWHRSQHDVIRAKLAEMEQRIQQGDRDSVMAALDLISAWFQTHTAVSDRMMGAHLRSHRRSQGQVQVRKPAVVVRGGPSCRRGSRRQPV